LPKAKVSVLAVVLHNIPEVRLSFNSPNYCRLAVIFLNFVDDPDFMFNSVSAICPKT